MIVIAAGTTFTNYWMCVMRTKMDYDVSPFTHHRFKILWGRRLISQLSLLIRARLFVTPRTAVHQASLSILDSRSLLKLTSIKLVMPSNHLILFSPSHSLWSSPASGPFPVSQFFTWGDQSTGASASASVLSMNIQDWFLLGWIGLISLLPKGLSGVFSTATIQKHLFFWCSAFFVFQLSHPYMTTGKTIAFMRQSFGGKVMSLLFNMLSRFVIAFLPRSVLISWPKSPSAVIFGAQENKTIIPKDRKIKL